MLVLLILAAAPSAPPVVLLRTTVRLTHRRLSPRAEKAPPPRASLPSNTEHGGRLSTPPLDSGGAQAPLNAGRWISMAPPRLARTPPPKESAMLLIA